MNPKELGHLLRNTGTPYAEARNACADAVAVLTLYLRSRVADVDDANAIGVAIRRIKDADTSIELMGAPSK